MPGIFSRFKSKDGKGKKGKNGRLDEVAGQIEKPRWVDAYTRVTVEPFEAQELIQRCTEELKARGTVLSFGFFIFQFIVRSHATFHRRNHTPLFCFEYF